MSKKKKGSKLAVCLTKFFDDYITEIHISTGIGYSKLTKAINDLEKLSLEDFYLIALRVAPNRINEFADEVFSESLTEYKDIDISGLSKFGEFLSNHMLSKNDIFKISGISETILTNLMKEKAEVKSKLIALKFYVLCKRLKRDFAESLKFLYPNAKLLEEEERKILRDNLYKKINEKHS